MSQSAQPVLVSILLAARNEEANIERCLISLNELDYPVENLEILIGDDDSSDRTAELIHYFIKDKPQFKYLKIKDRLGDLKGKANVLAQLGHGAEGQYLFFCDADISVKKTWLKEMLIYFTENTGVIIGLTRMKKSHVFADFLSLEWLFTLSVVKFCSLFQAPVTGLGNNMAVSKEAYLAIGGYEKIGFSIVEDYTLFMEIVKKGYRFNLAYSPKVLSESEPLNSFTDLMIQRKRWIQGVMSTVLPTKISMIFSMLIVPFLFVLIPWIPQLSLTLIAANYLIVTGIAMIAVFVLKQQDLWKTLFLFWFYLVGNSLLMLINFLLPGRIIWKGREY